MGAIPSYRVSPPSFLPLFRLLLFLPSSHFVSKCGIRQIFADKKNYQTLSHIRMAHHLVPKLFESGALSDLVVPFPLPPFACFAATGVPGHSRSFLPPSSSLSSSFLCDIICLFPGKWRRFFSLLFSVPPSLLRSVARRREEEEEKEALAGCPIFPLST